MDFFFVSDDKIDTILILIHAYTHNIKSLPVQSRLFEVVESFRQRHSVM